jgi:hypothetical protein
MTTEAMMAAAMRSLRRIIGVSPEWGRDAAELTRLKVRVSTDAEMAFFYQKMSVSYQKQHFSYHFPLVLTSFKRQFLRL